MNRDRIYGMSWILALAVVALLGLGTAAHATVYYWDVNGTAAGDGSSIDNTAPNYGPTGTWDGVNLYWNTDPTGGGGGTFVAAPTTSDDLNICNMPGEGNIAAGTITVSGAQSAQSLTFGAQTYQSVGMALVGGTVTLGGTGAINVLTSGTPTTVITTTLAGTAGLTKTGNALVLGGQNTYTGGTSIGGAMTLDFSNAAAPVNNIINGGALTLNGGALTIKGNASTANSQTFGDLTVNGISTITLTSNANPLTLNVGNINRGPNAFMVLTMPASGGVTTTQPNAGGILGNWLTLSTGQWAANDGSGNIVAYTGYTNLPATGSTIASDANSNVQFTSAGGGGNVALASATTYVNSLSQTTATAAVIDTAGKTLQLGANPAIMVAQNGGQALTIGVNPGDGTLSAGGATPGTAGQILVNNPSNPVTVNANLVDNGTGAVSIYKVGAAALTLAGNNTFSGGITMTGGQLNINTATALGTGPLSLSSSSVTNATGGAISISNSQTWLTGSTYQVWFGPSGTNKGNSANSINLGTAPVTLGNNGGGTQLSLVVNNATTTPGIVDLTQQDTLTVGGNIGESTPGMNIRKSGYGTLVLAGNNTFTGGIAMYGGFLAINSATALGTGPLTSGTNPGFANTSGNAVTVTTGNSFNWGGGPLYFDGPNNLNLGTGPVTMTTSGRAIIKGGTTFEMDGTITNGSGGSGIELIASISGGGGTWVLGGNRTYSGSTAIDSGSYAGTLVLSGASPTYNGTYTLSGGTLCVNNNQALGITSTVKFSGTALDNTSGGSITVTTGNNWELASGKNLTFLGSNPMNLGSGNVALDSNETVTVNASTLTVNGNITGGYSLTKAGAGTLVLNGTDNYGPLSGPSTIINAGTLQAATYSSVPGPVSVANGATLTVEVGSGGWLDSNIWNTLSSVNSNVWAAGSTLAFDTTGGNYPYGASGPITNAGLNVTKLGANTLTLTSANTYTGLTTVSAGTLAVGVNNAIPSGAGAGNLAVNSGATFDLAGHNQMLNGLVDGGGGGGKVDNTGAGAVTLTVGNNNTSSTFDGTIQNTGGKLSLTKVGAGTVIVNNPYFVTDPSNPSGYVANTYLGATTIVAGTLQFNEMAAKYSVFDTSGNGQGIDIQGGKAVLDWGPAGNWSDPVSFLLPALAGSYAYGWNPPVAVDPVRSTTAAADATHTHALGWIDDTTNHLFTVMYTLYGDTDLNGTVDGSDLNTVLSNFNKTGMTWSQGDFNYDGTVDGTDLNTVLSNFNQHLSVAGAVPEPSTLLLAAAGLAGLLAYAWRKRR